MANNFLASSVIPGNGLARHEHRQLLTILAIVVIVGAIMILGYRWNASRQAGSNEVNGVQMTSQQDVAKTNAAQEIQKAIVPVTVKEKATAGTELSNKVVPISASEKAAMGQQLLKAIVK